MSAAKKPEVGDTWYRYEDRRYGVANEFDEVVSSYVKLRLDEYRVTKVTPKGVWLNGSKFVLLSANKRFAAPTREDALVSLKARKARQIRILEGQLGHARDAVRLADKELAELQPKRVPAAAAADELVAAF